MHLLVDVALLNNDQVESKLRGANVLGPRVCVARNSQHCRALGTIPAILLRLILLQLEVGAALVP